MKRILSIPLSIALILTILQSCNKSTGGNDSMQTKVEFSFAAGQLKIANEQGLTNIVVSIEDMQGNIVLNSEKIAIYNMNGSYVSESISLVVGEYKLTRFLVLNASNDIVYAAPVSGSTNANSVENPLPLTFSAQTEAQAQVSPTVLSTYGSTPEDFGYVSFSFDVADTFDILVGASIWNDTINNYQLTNADIAIFSDTLVYSGRLHANNTYPSTNYDSLSVTNRISLPEKYDNFTIAISKAGYATYTKTFTKEELRPYGSEDLGPLVAVLETGCELPVNSAYFQGYPNSQRWPDATVYFDNASINDADSYVFDFGDGTVMINIAYKSMNEYTYSAPGNYKVLLTVTKGLCKSIAEQTVVIIPNDGSDSTITANAGADQIILSDTTHLDASFHYPATGKWTLISGTGNFADANNPKTGVTGIQHGTNIYRWTVTYGNKTDYDDVSVVRN